MKLARLFPTLPKLVRLCFLSIVCVAGTATGEPAAPPSNYLPVQGERFFILSESSFSSNELPTVRLEIQRNSDQLEEYGGVDINVYKIPDPIAFLRAQDNLHRIKVPAKPIAEGMANMLRLSWDKIWMNTRFAWRTVFSEGARNAATEAAPALKTSDDFNKPTALTHPPAYAPIPGIPLVDHFRYPVQRAKPITPPAGVALAGSSSGFLPNFEGNVRIPLGKQAPGLYLVEAFVGQYRALTLVFVSDTVVVSKTSSNELFAWVANRDTGSPSPNAELLWSDGVGVLKSGVSNTNGVVQFAGKSPETSYIFGRDAQGGVFISENFYHDSEIYNAKLYAVTDRPLYRPGDRVQLKILGREFKSARESIPVSSGDLRLTILDPSGTEVLSRKLRFDAQKGTETEFTLPNTADAGGWEIVFSKGEDVYGAAFRVANYVKPHFEINVIPAKSEFKTKEKVTGHIQVLYPDGKPVTNAKINLTVRAQGLSMVEGQLRYGGQRPITLQSDDIYTDNQGKAPFDLPASDDPARYILNVVAQDGAAYRVRSTKELLIERGASLWKLAAPSYFSVPGAAIAFSLSPQDPNASDLKRPTQWELIRLEDRETRRGKLGEANTLSLTFEKSGSYTLNLRDEKDNLLGAASHWVSGDGLKVIPGSIEIVLNKEHYRVGETAEALITFPSAAKNALLTLERDKVEAHAMMNAGAEWLSVSQVTPTQWKALIPVKDHYGPNMTFSVLYVDGKDYVFQNKGLRVEIPTVEVLIRPAQERYTPGETAKLDIETRIDGKPVAALVNLGVVDEMIYVLQPEIAPDIQSFFYHPRRNNVRTTVSLSFIGYDLARMPSKGTAPVRRPPSERATKLLERPRRDDTDTAGWWPSLMTNESGKASVSFKVPDALTRWRVTARAITPAGIVGQQTKHIESYKDFYVKWTGPATFREGDKPTVTLAAFNQKKTDSKVQLQAEGAGFSLKQDLTLHPGVNTITLPSKALNNGDVSIQLSQDGKSVDALKQKVNVLPPGWLSERVETLSIKDGEAPLTLPEDAQNIQMSLSHGNAASQFSRIADDLVDYPWGCVEQVSSRLIPLSFAYNALPASSPRVRDISQSLSTQRLRLVKMAGPEAIFSWWGEATKASAWLTAYAYYADWNASRALGIKLPEEHWRQVLEAYKKHGSEEPFELRTLAVWFMAEMKLPVRNLTEGLLQEEAQRTVGKQNARNKGSVWLGDASHTTSAQTLLLLSDLAGRYGLSTAPIADKIDAARSFLTENPDPLGQALIAMEQKSGEGAAQWLAQLGPEVPTLDRALALAWWHKALNGNLGAEPPQSKLPATWKQKKSAFGAPTWTWAGEKLPKNITVDTMEPMTAFVRYRSASPEAHKLPVEFSRELYRLVPIKAPKSNADDATPTLAAFTLEEVKGNEIRSNELYLEEITLSSKQKINFGLLEVPLPPGADVESGTWGIRLKEANGELIPIEKAQAQPGNLSYAIPIDHLNGQYTVRHLLRFGSHGNFVVPPARFYRMYQPEDKAFETQSKQRVLTVK